MAIDKKAYLKIKYPNIKIHKNGIKFWFDFTIAGKRYSRLWDANQLHTKADRLRQAQAQLEKYRQEAMKQQCLSADMDATVQDYYEKLKSMKSWRDTLVKKYDYYFEKHLSKLGKIKIRDMKPAHFTTLNASLSYLAPRTRLQGYEILKPLFELAVEDEIIDKTPIKRTHIPKRKQLEEKKIITDAVTKYRMVHDAIHRLFGTDDLIILDDRTKIQCYKNPHHRSAFLFGFYGRRLNEVLQLQWDDIDFVNDTYRVKGKTSKVNTDMVFALPADVKEALLEFSETNGNIYMVKSLDIHHKKIRVVTGIEEFTFHWMRNLVVSAMASQGVDITHLSAMLGHTDSATIRKYLSLQREASTKATNEVAQKLLS